MPPENSNEHRQAPRVRHAARRHPSAAAHPRRLGFIPTRREAGPGAGAPAAGRGRLRLILRANAERRNDPSGGGDGRVAD